MSDLISPPDTTYHYSAFNFAVSPTTGVVYAAQRDGWLRGYDGSTGAEVSAWKIGESLWTIAISKDGSFALVTSYLAASFIQADSWPDNKALSLVFKVDLATGGTQMLTYGSTGSDFLLADVAFTDNNTAVFTESIWPGFGGWTPLIKLDTDTGTFTRIPGSSYYASSYGGSSVASSLTQTAGSDKVLLGMLNLSSAQFYLIDDTGAAVDDNGIYQNGVYGPASGVEAMVGSGNSGFIALGSAGALHLYDGEFDYIGDLAATYPFLSGTPGVTFSADGSTLFAIDAAGDRIVAISTATRQMTGSFAIGDYTYQVLPYGDELVRSLDGWHFYVSTTAGLVSVPYIPEVLGTGGNDTMYGTFRPDWLNGLAGNDTLFGYGEADRLDGGADNDTLYGDAGNDTLNGGTGDDSLVGGAGVDTTDGGAGNDWHFVDSSADIVLEAVGGGTDRVLTSVGYTLAAGVEVEQLQADNQAGTTALNLTGNAFGQTIIGNAGANILVGGGGSDYLAGLGGDDVLTGSADAASSLQGGTGDDWFYVNNGGDSVLEAAGEGYDRVLASVSFTLTGGQAVEQLQTSYPGGSSAINLTGNNLGQVLFGNEGANVLSGGGGSDTLLGFGGNDALIGNADAASTLQGGTGDDWYFVHRTGDSLVELAGEGNDRVFAGVNYTLSAGQAFETLSTLDGAGSAAVDLTGNELNQIIIGNAGANVLGGGGGSDTLLGYGGNDTLVGNADAASTLQGGTGDDWYFVFRTGDSLVELAGEGSDRLLAGVNYILSAGQAIETLSTLDGAGAVAIDLAGNELAQAIIGNAGANVLSGGGGADTLVGLGGNDTLYGGDGDDQLAGGLGADMLDGGAGADLLIFSDALGGGNVDSVAGFTSGQDRLFLENDVFTGLAAGSLAAGAFAAGTVAADADDRIIYSAATGSLWFDVDGSGAGAAVLFATLTPGATLVASDIAVV
jgi:Ca2+-binding RTX toxin-like protein